MKISRREMLALGSAVPAAVFLQGFSKPGGFKQTPLAPDAARLDPLHSFWDGLRSEFPLRDGLHYFDTASLGPSPHEVLERMTEVALETASEGATHLSTHVEEARQTVAHLVGADPDEIALTRNASEGMNLVARGLRFEPGSEILLVSDENPTCVLPWLALARDTDVPVRRFPPSFELESHTDALWKTVRTGTRVLVVSHVLASVGSVVPLRELCHEARRRGIWSVVDGTQAVGIVPLDLHDLGADCYVAGGHRWILGPPETGFLYVRRDRWAEVPSCFAGPLPDTETTDMRRFEYGTRSASLAAGLAAAIRWQEAVGLDLLRARATALAGHLHTGLQQLSGVEVLTQAQSTRRTPLVTFRVVRRPGVQVVQWLERELGMRLHQVGGPLPGAVRASIHPTNRLEDVDWLLEGVRVLGA